MPGRDTPLLRNRAALHNFTHHIVAVDFFADERHLAVVNQQPVAGLGILGKMLVGGRHTIMGAFNIIDGDTDLFPIGPEGSPLDEPAEANLGAL